MAQEVRAVHLRKDLSTTQEEILPANPSRRYALIANPSDTQAWLSLGVPAIPEECIPLNSGGGNYEINATNLFRGKIYAVSAGASKRLTLVEW